MVSISLVPALALLYFDVSIFRSMRAVPNMAVFCSSFTSWFPGMLLMYFLNYFEMVPLVPIVTGITLVFTFHVRCISVVRSLYFKIFSASFLITFLSPMIATSINIHVPFSLSQIIMSGLLLGMVLSVCTCWFHNMGLPYPFTCFYWFWYMFIPVFFVQLYPCFLAYVLVFIIIITQSLITGIFFQLLLILNRWWSPPDFKFQTAALEWKAVCCNGIATYAWRITRRPKRMI